DFAGGREVLLTADADLWAEDDDHQRNVGLGRRRVAVDVPAGRGGTAGGNADLGRVGGGLKLPGADGWGAGDFATCSDLWLAWGLGSGESEDRAGYRGGE